MRILLYINTLSKYNYGNLKSNLELMEGFLEKGIEVFLIVNKRSPHDLSVPVEVISLDAKGDFDRPFKLARIVKTLKPDAVIANMLTQMVTASIAKLLRRGKGIKFIGIERDTRAWHRKFWKLPYRFFIKKVYENMDHIVAVSPAVERDLKKTFFIKEDKIKLIYDSVDSEDIRKKAKEPIEENLKDIFSNFKILTVLGRIDAQKEPFLALEVFTRLKKETVGVKLCFIGSGELEAELRKKIADNGLEEDVLILGYKENPFKYLKASKILLHTASREGLGRVILEAGILGIPTVAFYGEESGYTEIIEKYNCGILVPFGNISEMSRKIKKVLEDKTLYQRLSLSANRICEDFTKAKVADEYIKLLQ